ncbi:UDP-N-acetylmuramoyl-tripeptide--D-alanyl-D-alanine ligase [Dubosiella newyorkensis]|uniref:UDP-N-acetylmuramoyl-tripeptide--D-alanyl-D- alanine ligase n=1 Tax=Dubosiella newyorkensis TaxID=1862672 RepID=UPI003312FC09
MIQKTIAEIATYMQSEVCGPYDPDTIVKGVTIDSRNVQKGNVYVPIVGAHNDGHSFIEQVKNGQAALAFWQKDHTPYPEGIPLILVEDTIEALGQLAQAYLASLDAEVIAITGSNGKTSCKDMLKSVYSLVKKSAETPGNRNNEIGLPLTILDFDADLQVAILEMGMENKGEITYLTKIAPPDIAIITTIGSAHMENLGGKKQIAEAKLEIYDGLKEGGVLIYNKESPEIEEVLQEKKLDPSKTIRSFGQGGTLSIVSSIDYGKDSIFFKTNGIQDLIELHALGAHQAMNALPVILAAKYDGIEDATILQGLKNLEMTKMRTQLLTLQHARVLDDSYKSNPESAKAAIDTLLALPAQKHIAILGDMLDLGNEERKLHASIGKYAKEHGVDQLYTYGPLSVESAKAFGEHGASFQTKEEIVQALLPVLQEDCVILIKGSRAMAMDTIVKQLTAGGSMAKLKLGVVFGGQSSEYSVSLHSTGSFLHQIDRSKYDITCIGIDEGGQFFIYTGPIEAIESDTWKKEEYIHPCSWMHKGVYDKDNEIFIPLDVIFPVLHGKNGEDGAFQGLAQMMNIHYVGSDILASAMCMDKEVMHILCDQAHIPCARYICLKAWEEQRSFEEIQEQLPLPWVIKPCNAGSSYGVHFVEEKSQFEEAKKDAFKWDGRGKILIEEAINGFEIGCAVLGNDQIQVGSVDEIEIQSAIFDFEGKYAMKGANIYCPARIDGQTFANAQALAKKAFRIMGCTGMARVDMFVTEENEIVLNEINTLPGFTATSRYPSMMQAAGISFTELIDLLIDLAMEKEVSAC